MTARTPKRAARCAGSSALNARLDVLSRRRDVRGSEVVGTGKAALVDLHQRLSPVLTEAGLDVVCSSRALAQISTGSRWLQNSLRSLHRIVAYNSRAGRVTKRFVHAVAYVPCRTTAHSWRPQRAISHQPAQSAFLLLCLTVDYVGGRVAAVRGLPPKPRWGPRDTRFESVRGLRCEAVTSDARHKERRHESR